ncbi:diacylglycerol kinase [Sphingobacterium mizutaii]|uniref:diacylglycerol kinase n=1 Tax=Sphingobacterium mizutaii TaxID=1010 RepID=UPI001624D882|nr:diacylglycerol kinase family protein [Sphingobacterium mizutaii]
MSKEKEPFSLKKRIKSFEYSIAGLAHLLKLEHNARIHVIAAIMVVVAGWLLEISSMEWVAIVICIGFVFTTETLNTSIENICDNLTTDIHPHIKIIKDLASGAVLISAVTAVVVALIIFLPKILSLV